MVWHEAVGMAGMAGGIQLAAASRLVSVVSFLLSGDIRTSAPSPAC
jgi:hypothetical protein